MDLSDLTTQFTGLMNRRDLTANSTLVTNFINQSIMRIQRELRCPAMEKQAMVTITAPYNGLVIPSDFIELISIIPQADYSRQLAKVRIEKALNYATFNTDIPEVYARLGGVWILGPAPAVGCVLDIYYYAELAPLVNPTDTNAISIVAWDLIVNWALSAACDYYNDKRGPGFEQRGIQIKDSLQSQADDDELDGVTQMQPAYSYPDDDTDNYEIWVP